MKTLLPVLLSASSIVSATAADWPNWRGPTHDGVTTETGWTWQWPADGPPRLWKTSVGTGFATVAVSGSRVYTVGNKSNTDTVFCLDADTGKPIWQYSYPCDLVPNLYEGGPSATPTVEGDHVYTFSKAGDLFCLTTDTGKVIWEKHLGAEKKVEAPGWGFASSPITFGNLLVLNAGPSGLAVNKDSGQVAWSSDGAGAGYSSAVPCNINGVSALLMLFGTDVAALEAATGKQIWRQPWKTDYDLNVADAVVAGSRVFVSSDYGHGSAVLQLNDGSTVWQNKALCNHIQSCVLRDGYVYGIDGNVGGDTVALKCVDLATGDVKWSQENWGGSVILAGTHLIALTARGELVVADASPSGFKPISRAQVLGGKCWTAPVLANGRIYCRNAKGDLVCLDVKQK